MTQEIQEAVCKIEEKKTELEEQKKLLLSLSEKDVVDEEKWHEICETPLRYSPILAVLAKNVFPEAEDVEVHANNVSFMLKGFRIQIPTSRARGINVDTSWYKIDRGEPKFYPDAKTKRMADFFKARDEKEGWKKQAKLLINAPYKDWVLFVLWFSKYRWKLPDKGFWEEQYEKELRIHRKSVEKYHSERKEIKEKTCRLFNEVLPILNRFSEEHYKYNGESLFAMSVEDIRKAEQSVGRNEEKPDAEVSS